MNLHSITVVLCFAFLAGCSAPTTPPAPPALTPAPALPDISIIAGMGAAAQTTEWELPSAEQARAGGGGGVPEGISIQMGIFEDQARLRMPASYTFHTAWNGASYENTGRDDLTRFATYSRNNNGEIVWSQINGGPSFNEYPIDWVYENGALQVRLEQEFGVIPDSKEAAVIFTGDASGPDDALTFGEKAAIVKNVATLADGTQYYLEYFDFQKGEWAVNTNVLAALLPEANQSNLIWQDEDGQWLAGQAGTEKALLQFDLETKQWVEAEPIDWEAARLRMIDICGANGCIEKETNPNWGEDGYWLKMFFSDEIIIESINETEAKWYATAYTLDKDNQLIPVKVLMQHVVDGKNKSRLAVVYLYAFSVDYSTADNYTSNPIALSEEELLELMQPYSSVFTWLGKGEDNQSLAILQAREIQPGGQLTFRVFSASMNKKAIDLNVK